MVNLKSIVESEWPKLKNYVSEHKLLTSAISFATVLMGI